MEWNIEIAIIVIKHAEINHLSVLNNSDGGDMPLKK